jgi:hypothetical protein
VLRSVYVFECYRGTSYRRLRPNRAVEPRERERERESERERERERMLSVTS